MGKLSPMVYQERDCLANTSSLGLVSCHSLGRRFRSLSPLTASTACLIFTTRVRRRSCPSLVPLQNLSVYHQHPSVVPPAPRLEQPRPAVPGLAHSLRKRKTTRRSKRSRRREIVKM